MTIFVRIEYAIDDVMARHAVEHLLNAKKRPSKSAVVKLCSTHLAREGALFETEPQFDTSAEALSVDPELVDKWFNKIWK